MKKDSFSDPKVMTAPETITNQQKVMRIFEYFGKGDVPGIIEMCSDDCDWLHGGNPAIIPFSKPFKGKKGVGQFFQTIGQTLAVTKMVPSDFKVSGNEVSHDFLVEATVKTTGKPYVAAVRYNWTFDQKGKINRYHSTGDFSKLEAAFKS